MTDKTLPKRSRGALALTALAAVALAAMMQSGAPAQAAVAIAERPAAC